MISELVLFMILLSRMKMNPMTSLPYSFHLAINQTAQSIGIS